jgi:hypothetical protein
LIFFRKKKDTSVYNDIPNILDSMDEEIEKQLESEAEKSNLTVANVKSILKVCVYKHRILHNCVELYDRHIRYHMLLRERHFTIISLLFTFYKVSEFIFHKGEANFLKSFFKIVINVSPLLSQ